jgi:hypothetical protein
LTRRRKQLKTRHPKRARFLCPDVVSKDTDK